ncbi:MAG TPA: MarR family winged helix-turn-helix transcriptional regulator [Mucilaginibacter sp.]|nr:MarR family winged helix-turn-helix transcriptional regulator [Mucilaginibacter sp.]
MKLVEPISRKLIRLGKLYLGELEKATSHLDINQYYYVLTLICYHDGKLTQKALGDMLGKDKSAMVSIIDNLSENGFVFREVNPADRREHLLRVTEKAKKAVPEIVHTFENMNNAMTENISEDDMAVFYNVLLQMQQNLHSISTQSHNITI